MLNDKIYLFSGDDRYTIDKKVKSLTLLIPDKAILTYNYLDVEKIKNELIYKDLFSENKIIIIKNNIFKASKDEQDVLLDCLKNMEKSIYFICISDSFAKASSLYKTIFSKCNHFDISQPKEGGIYSYVKDILEEENIKIKSDELKKVIELIGNNASSVLFEIKKLYLKNGIINEDLINREIIKENYDIWHLFNIFCEKDPYRLQSAIDSYIKNGYSAIDIFFFLYKEIRNLYIIKVIMDDYKIYDYKTISYKVKMNPFKVKNIMVKLKSFNQIELTKYIRNLIDIQRKIYNNSYMSGELLKSSLYSMLT